LNRTLKDWVQIKDVKVNVYAAGGAIHIVTKDDKKIRILVDEE